MFMLPKMKSGTVPLSGGARAGRPWGGLCVESDDPPRLAPATAVAAPATPPRRGLFEERL
jgi:hypothetical protein